MDRGEVAFTRMEKVIFGEDAAAAAKASPDASAPRGLSTSEWYVEPRDRRGREARQALGNTTAAPMTICRLIRP